MSAYFTLKNLTDHPDRRDLGTVFDRISGRVTGSGEGTQRAQFRIANGEEQSCWSFELGPGTCKLHNEGVDRPDFEIITDPETWWQIAEGKLAPLRAFVGGKLRLRGDVELCETFLRQLAEPLERS